MKGGANFNLSENHNVFANLGYISRAPKFSYGAFMTSTTSNVINKDAKNEKVFMVDLGYGFKSSWLTANVTAYYTKWMDKSMTKSGTMEDMTEYYMNMTGVNALHKGVKLILNTNRSGGWTLLVCSLWEIGNGTVMLQDMHTMKMAFL